MNLEDYREAVIQIEKEAEEKVNLLRSEYVSKNTKYSLGDIIECTYGIILIDKILPGVNYNGEPEAYYFGNTLTQKLTPKKNKARDWISQSHVIKKLN
jgi:uncharacterized protein (DUF2225 family)